MDLEKKIQEYLYSYLVVYNNKIKHNYKRSEISEIYDSLRKNNGNLKEIIEIIKTSIHNNEILEDKCFCLVQILDSQLEKIFNEHFDVIKDFKKNIQPLINNFNYSKYNFKYEETLYVINHSVYGDPKGKINEPNIYKVSFQNFCLNDKIITCQTIGIDTFGVYISPPEYLFKTKDEAEEYIKLNRNEIIKKSFEDHKKYIKELRKNIKRKYFTDI
jgi:hypothetical protein